MVPVFVNRFTVSTNDEITRIVFEDLVVSDKPGEERACVVMTTADALALAELILKLRQGARKQ